MAALRARGVGVTIWPDGSLREWLDSCEVIVDALLGTGTARPISGDLANLLIAVRQAVAARRTAAPDLVDPANVMRNRGFSRGDRHASVETG